MYEEDIHIWKVLHKQCETDLTHLILVTVMWTKCEVGRSMRSRCIDLKRKGYRRTYQNTERQTKTTTTSTRKLSYLTWI